MAIVKFKGKAPELIKIAIAAGTVDLFFDSSNDYEPEWFDSTALEYTYGDQIFTDVDNQKNMVWLSSDISGECLVDMFVFINNGDWLLENGFWNDDGIWRDDRNWID